MVFEFPQEVECFICDCAHIESLNRIFAVFEKITRGAQKMVRRFKRESSIQDSLRCLIENALAKEPMVFRMIGEAEVMPIAHGCLQTLLGIREAEYGPPLMQYEVSRIFTYCLSEIKGRVV